MTPLHFEWLLFPKRFTFEGDEEKIPQLSPWSTTLLSSMISSLTHFAKVLVNTFWLFWSPFARPYLSLTPLVHSMPSLLGKVRLTNYPYLSHFFH